MEIEKAPRLANALVEFIKAFNNPDEVEGDSLPIKLYMLNAYDVSYNFSFKWVVMRSEIEELLEWNKDFQLDDDGKALYMVCNKRQNT